MAVFSSDPDRGFFGHPRALMPLFFTEMWERFSFYGMRTLLILYLVSHFAFPRDRAYDTMSAYLALVYLLPLFGGLIADRLLGYQRAVMIGATLMLLGHVAMAYEGGGGEDPVAVGVMFFALALLSVGNGFMKPNISSMVGKLYAPDDQRRDAGFSLFYFSINLGAFAATLICGWLGETYGWSYGFGAAAIGMGLGLFVFQRSRPMLPPDELVSMGTGAALAEKPRVPAWMWAAIPVAVAASWGLMQRADIVGYLLAVSAFVMIGWVLVMMFTKATPVARDRMIVALVLTLFAIFFWMLFDQSPGSLKLLADHFVDRQGWAASQFEALNPMFIVLMAPLMAGIWTFLAVRGKDLSLPVKFALGLLFNGAAFGLLVIAMQDPENGMLMSLWWLVLFYWVQAIGELCLSPIGLSMITRLSMPGTTGVMMGIWFLSTAGGAWLAGQTAKWFSAPEEVTGFDAAYGFTDLFWNLFWPACVAGVIVLALSPWLKRMMHVGVDTTGVRSAGLDEGVQAGNVVMRRGAE
ncbi:peptide MFS transporter [Indioceanicola profundi]|uniref:peptide MFS transporter n=1 Tax=Indioceanicola profundi TaxID=2220096 RepID=UPI000E6AD78A|nr:oligopeptide:H+ symporter [Indioceanicola profundi]